MLQSDFAPLESYVPACGPPPTTTWTTVLPEPPTGATDVIGTVVTTVACVCTAVVAPACDWAGAGVWLPVEAAGELPPQAATSNIVNTDMAPDRTTLVTPSSARTSFESHLRATLADRKTSRSFSCCGKSSTTKADAGPDPLWSVRHDAF